MKNPRLKFRAMSSLVVVFAMLSMVACKKDSDDPAPQTGVEGSWQLTAINLVPAVSGISDYFAYYALIGDKCPSQTTFNFKANGGIEITAPAACNATKDELKSLIEIDDSTTWKEEGNKLVLTTGSNVREADLTVDASSMIISDDAVISIDNQTHNVAFVFKRM